VADNDIASSYATALIEALKTPDDVLQVGSDLELVASLYRDVPALPRMLDNPGQPFVRRRDVLEGMFTRMDLHPVTRRFLHLVLEKGRVREVPNIVAQFQRLRDAKLQVSSAEVVTAVPLDEAQKSDWEHTLSRITGRKVRVTYKTDGALLGGALTRVGSVVYDGSLRTQLSRIRESLVKE
jgi:F-type H+-transporting ATPase subunit delta